MKRELSPILLAVLLVLGCIIFRLLSSWYPAVIPNISPLMALAYVGAMYLPRRWGWLVGPAALLVTDLAFCRVNYLTGGSGSMFSWWTLISIVLFAAAGGLGILVSRRKSLAKIVSGSLVCSLVFYVISNTFSWWHDVAIQMQPGYAASLSGWIQANTVGLAGYPPTWLFLRNGMAGDLFFLFVLLAVLDCGFLLGHSPARDMRRMA